ncbi:hypothetical protein BYT27DRAFT_7333267 [Phlegmacium glaucopus]|nr:hypothetical protein BYT27DRAFT_7333267 [Phlegmacium glaucopus]
MSWSYSSSSVHCLPHTTASQYMAPRTRRTLGRLKSSQAAALQTSLSTQAINTRGFPTLADEIYLEIISYLPSVPIPTPITSESPLYPEIRRSRHETLLSLSQTSRSLRRFFWRYLWQRIEVREGMKIRDQDDTSEGSSYLTRSDPWSSKARERYTIELVRQLEIVTVRNPQLAQYVNYLDIFIGEYSINTVAELARCLSLFSNLHTVQIDVTISSGRSLGRVFERTFKKYSYPQIRNVFVMFFNQSLIASCPEARHIGFTRRWALLPSLLQTIIDHCPRLEVLEDPGDFFWKYDTYRLMVDNFPNLRTITISPLVITSIAHPSEIDILKKLNHLQNVIIFWKPSLIHLMPWRLSHAEKVAHLNRIQEDWIERVKRILVRIQLRDKLDKTIVIRNYEGEVRKILIKPVDTSED